MEAKKKRNSETPTETQERLASMSMRNANKRNAETSSEPQERLAAEKF